MTFISKHAQYDTEVTSNFSHALQAKVLLGAALGTLLLSGCQTSDKDALVIEPVYSQTMTQASGKRSVDKEEVARVRTALAAQYIRENSLDAAQQQLEKAFAANSRYAPAYDMMGVLLQKEGSASNLKKAESYFKQAISFDPEFEQARNNYGVYLSQMQRYREAADQFEIAGAALGYDGRIGALENLGRTYLQLNDRPAATKAFLRALEGNRNSLIAHIELVDLLLDAKRVVQAQNLYDETLLLIRGQGTTPRLLMQGIRLANAQNDTRTRQQLAQQLLSAYPLSAEAKQVKEWLKHPEAPWQ
ncbi:type IV pilus biogenesis/stability protein PilW [Psychrobacter aestuarii]|uniref:Type IV pilus biogenesis/stability protein PilW n=1 Tax=Psychrobacter aestuarii TaxID=556327 RepID=A0ABN0VNM4_9GAMM|nr:type IV pilus biogenesis/stability protein PilW [Psychrobacter aestuarii]